MIDRTHRLSVTRQAGLLDVDLSDGWAPFIFSDSDGPGAPVLPNGYRKTFVDLANDRADPDELYLAGGATRAIDLSVEARRDAGGSAAGVPSREGWNPLRVPGQA